MDVREFDFDLPAELIAQEPPAERGAARLLHLTRATGTIVHTTVAALPDLLRGAFRIATSGRPGPVALVIPHDVLDAEWAGGGLDMDDRTARAPAFRTVADPASVSEAASMPSRAPARRSSAARTASSWARRPSSA